MIRLSKCALGAEERAAVDRVLANEFLGTGPETRAFEEELAAYLGDDSSVTCVATGTVALQLALQACGIGPGDEVLVPTLTFVASFQAISGTGAAPVACDVEEATGLLDLADAERRLTPRTRAIMPVHYASAVGEIDMLHGFARDHNLRCVEDAAHAFGCLHLGRRIGSFGDVACFSFDGIKNITSGEGGAIVTRDAEVLRRAQDARLLGVERDTEKRYRRERSWEFDVTEQGWRAHMSDVFAAIGRVQLRRLDRDLGPRRIERGRRYRANLKDVAGLRFFAADLGNVIPHIQPVRILGGRRDAVRKALIEGGSEAGIHYKPNHLLTMYGGGKTKLPVAEKLYEELLTLPLHPDLSLDEVDKVSDIIRRSL